MSRRKAGFEVRDVESLREHYALTLKNWLARYEAHRETILDMLGPVGYRRWRIYLAGARWVFESGYNSIHQALLYKTVDGKGAAATCRSIAMIGMWLNPPPQGPSPIKREGLLSPYSKS